jgi:AraC family transcriptional activator FtrA
MRTPASLQDSPALAREDAQASVESAGHGPRVDIVVVGYARQLEVAAAYDVFAHADQHQGSVRVHRSVWAAARPGSPSFSRSRGAPEPGQGLLIFTGSGLTDNDAEVDPLRRLCAEAMTRGSRMAAIGGAVLALARLGVLDGRDVTTHRFLIPQLETFGTDLAVRPEALFVDDGQVATGAGGAATLDLALHLVADMYGTETARRVEDTLVVGARRMGIQRQSPLSSDSVEPLATLLAWMKENCHLELTVEDLSARAFMSRRSLTRQFRATTGTTPYAWLVEQRIVRARDLMVSSPELSVQEIARTVGFGTAAAFRLHFQRHMGCAPVVFRAAVRSGETGRERPSRGAPELGVMRS